jgi:uncharacterized Fe-S center protein
LQTFNSVYNVGMAMDLSDPQTFRQVFEEHERGVHAAAMRILGRQTDAHPPSQVNVLEACLAACRACADECELHAAHHRHCAISAAECRRCEQACNDLVAAIG